MITRTNGLDSISSGWLHLALRKRQFLGCLLLIYDILSIFKSSNLILVLCFNYLLNSGILFSQKIINGLELAISRELMAVHISTTSEVVAINGLLRLLTRY